LDNWVLSHRVQRISATHEGQPRALSGYERHAIAARDDRPREILGLREIVRAELRPADRRREGSIRPALQHAVALVLVDRCRERPDGASPRAGELIVDVRGGNPIPRERALRRAGGGTAAEQTDQCDTCEQRPRSFHDNLLWPRRPRSATSKRRKSHAGRMWRIWFGFLPVGTEEVLRLPGRSFLPEQTGITWFVTKARPSRMASLHAIRLGLGE